jgi:hypothetical protein
MFYVIAVAFDGILWAFVASRYTPIFYQDAFAAFPTALVVGDVKFSQ